MLQPHFSEGQAWTRGREIELPDDSADAMQTIFDIIHFRKTEYLSRPPPPKLICEVAVVADKYDMIKATSFAIQSWIQTRIHHNQTAGLDDLGSLMVAAYIFALQELFAQVTRQLVIHHTGTFGALFEVPGVIEHVGHDVVGKFPTLV